MTLAKDLRELSNGIGDAARGIHSVIPAAGNAIAHIARAVDTFAAAREQALVTGLLEGTLPVHRAVNAGRQMEGLPVRDFALKGLRLSLDIPWAGGNAQSEYRRLLEAIFHQVRVYPTSVPLFDGVNPGFDEKLEFLLAKVPLAHGSAEIDVKIPVTHKAWHTASAVISSAWEPEATYKLANDSDLLGFSWINDNLLKKVAYQIWGPQEPDIVSLVDDDQVRELAASYFNWFDGQQGLHLDFNRYDEIVLNLDDSLQPGKVVQIGVTFQYLPGLPVFRVLPNPDEDATPMHETKNLITRGQTAQTGVREVKFIWNDMTDIYKNVFLVKLQTYVKACIEGASVHGSGN